MSVRAELQRLMRATLADEAAHADWTYTQYRPRYMPRDWYAGERIYGDCSKGVQFLCYWAGLKDDPMGMGYGGFGNSQSLWVHLRHVGSPSELEVGDIITFGYNGDEHATMVLEPGNDPLLWSFGHQGAPNTYRLSQDGRQHQLLKINAGPLTVTPQDKLRAKTGFFSWVAWKLGEGEWKHYGKANRTVRPNVPGVIPLSWWKRYAQFLLNRKKGNKPKPPKKLT